MGTPAVPASRAAQRRWGLLRGPRAAPRQPEPPGSRGPAQMPSGAEWPESACSRQPAPSSLVRASSFPREAGNLDFCVKLLYF